MSEPLHHQNEGRSNTVRDHLAALEPQAQRTYTPTQAVIAKSAGIWHWTPEDRRLYDFSSGVLVSNLGHNPQRWTQRLLRYLGWSASGQLPLNGQAAPAGYFEAVPLTAYNAVTEYLSYGRGRSEDSRLSELWFGQGATINSRALEAALAMAV